MNYIWDWNWDWNWDWGLELIIHHQSTDQERLTAVQESLLENQAKVTTHQQQQNHQSQQQHKLDIKQKSKDSVAQTQTQSQAQTLNLQAQTQASSDGDSLKPWVFVTTDTTLTMSWIAFALLIAIPCSFGIMVGCLYRKYVSEGGSGRYANLNTSAHDVYY